MVQIKSKLRNPEKGVAQFPTSQCSSNKKSIQIALVYGQPTYIYQSIYLSEVHTIRFQTFFLWTFKIVVDSWKFSMLWLYILWDDRPMFMISGSKEQLQQQLEFTY